MDPARSVADPGWVNWLAKTDPNARPRVRYIDEIILGSGGNLLLGFWLIASTALLDYRDGDPVVTDLVAGASIAALAVGRVALPARRTWLSWINVLLGSWLLVSAMLLAKSHAASLNEAVVGFLVIFLAALSGGAAESGRRRSDV